MTVMKTVKSPPSTKQDIDNLYKKIKGEFATKDDLKAFATKDDLKQVKDEIVEMKDEIVEMKDEIMGELKSQQENQKIHNYSHSRINDDLDDHETRIRKLEKTSATA
ncbi:hypothetical protein CO010_03310 [Candidatus Shapirobacteria bacterium CG_4_8_14_3_um_filter_39_11]|uniref:Uncharacterized protein n=2 Tax=Candidatus Shapironibacteriota TaxID=1752721 RepID=A0A2M8GFR0_9BACT|nr:MAG: hypothetical protein CO010_03310 [Candidatus Shapirobacteria bacterium CG_4_8_14_3_um_filter_39_11]